MGNQQASFGRGHASPAHAAATGNSATRSSRRSRRSGHAPPTEDVDDNAQHHRRSSYPPTSGQRVGSVSSARLSAPPHSQHPSPHRRRTSANPPAHVLSETASGATAATAAPPGRLGSHAPSVSSLTTAAPAATALGAAAAVPNSGSGGWEGGYAARHTASSSPEHLTWREHDNDDEGSGNAMSRAASSMRMPNGTLMSADEAASGLTSEGGTPGAPHADSGAAAGSHVFAAEAVTVATSSVAAAAPSSGGSGGRAGEAEEPNAASSSSSLAAGPRSSPSRSTQGRTRGAPSPPLPPPPPPSSLSLQQRLSEELALPLIVRASRQGSISAARISIGEESNSNSGGAARQHTPSPEAHPPLPLPPPLPVQTTTSAARSSKKTKKGAKGDAARDGSQDAGAVPSPPPPKHAAGGLMGGLFNPRSSRFLFRKSSSASSSAPASPLQHHDGTRGTSSAAAAAAASPALSSAQTQASDAALGERVERASQLPERPAEEAASRADQSTCRNEEGGIGVTGEKREVSNSAVPLQPAPFVQEQEFASLELPQSPSLALPVSLPESTSTATTATTRVVSLPLEGAPSWSITHHKTDTDAALPSNANTTTTTATTTAPADAVTNGSGGAVVSLLLPAERSAARSIDGTPLTAAAAAAVDRPSSSFTVKRETATHAAAALRGFEVAEGSVSEQRTQRDDVGDDSRSRSASSRSSSDNASGNTPSGHFHQRVHEAVDNDEEEGEATAPTEEVAPRPSAAAAAAAAGDANADAAKEDSHSTTSTDTNSAPILPPPPTASFAEAMWGVRAAARSAVQHPTRREGEGAQPVAAGGGGGGSGSNLSNSGSSTGPTSSPVYSPRTTHSRSGRGPTAYGATTVTDTTARVSPRSPYSSPPPPLVNTAGSESRSPTHGVAHDAAPHLRSRKSVSQSAIIAAWNRMGARSGTLPATALGPSSPLSGSGGGGTRMSSSNGGGGAVEHAATADGAYTVAAGSESECHPSLSSLSPPGGPPASQQHGVRGDHDSGSSIGAAAQVTGPINTVEKTTAVVVAPHGAETHHIAVVPVRRRSVLTRQRGHPSHLVSPPSLKDGDAAEAPPAPREADVGVHGDASPLEPPPPPIRVAEAPHVSAENSSFALSSNVAHMLTVGADEKDGDGARRESLNSAAATTTADEVVPDVAGPPSTPYMATYTLPTFFTFTEAGEQQQQQQQQQDEEEEAHHRGAGEPSISSRPFGGWDSTTPVSAAQERSDHDTRQNPVSSDGALPIPVFVVPAVRVNGTDSASHSRVSSGALDFAESSEASTSATIRIQHTTTDFEGDAGGVRTTSDPMDGRSMSETSLVAHRHRSPRSDRRRLRGPLAASGTFTASDAARAASVTVAPLTPRVVHLRRSLSDMSPLVVNDNDNGNGGINASAHANRSAGLVWSNPSSPMARAIAGAYRYASVTPGSDARDAAVEEEHGDDTSDGVRCQRIREQQQEHCASPPTTAAASRSGSASSVSAVGPSAALPGGTSPPLNNEAHQRAQQAAFSSATAAAAAAATSASARLMPHWRERLTPIQTQSLSPRSSSATRDELALALSGYLHLNSNGGEDSGDYTSLAGSRRRRLSSASQGPPPLAQQLPKSATITTATPPAQQQQQQQLPQQMHMQPLHHQLSGSGVQWKEVSLLPSAAGTPSGAAAGLIRSAPEDEDGAFEHRRVEGPSGADTFQVGRLDRREDQRQQQQQQQQLHHHVGDVASLWSGVESPVLWGEESPRSWQRSNVAEADEEEEMEEEVAELSYRNDVDDDLDEDDDNGYQPVHRLRHLRPPHATRNRPTQQQQQQQQQQHQSNASGGGALQLHRGGGGHAYLGGFSPRNPPRRYRASSPAEESSLPCTPPDEQRIGDSLRRLLRSGGSGGGGGFLPSSTSDQDIPHNRTFTTSFADGAARMPLTRYEPPMPSNRNTFTAFVPLADISSSHLLASATAIFQGGYQQENSGCSSNSGRPSSGAAANGSGAGGAGSPGAAALRMATSDTPMTADTLLLTGNSSPRMVRPTHGRVAVVAGASGGQLTSPLFSSVSTAATHHVSGGYSPVQGSLSLPVSGGGAVPAQPMHGGEGVERLALPFLVAYTREDEAAATPLPVSVRAGVKPALRSLPQKRKNRVGPAAVGAAPTTAATDTRAAATAESPLLRPAEAEPRLSLNAEAAAPVQAKEAVPAPPSPGTTITTTTTTITTIRTQESPATSPQSAHASGPAGRSSQRSSGVHSGSDGTRFVEVPEAAQRSSSGSETGLRRHASARALTPHTLSESSCAMVRTNSEPIFAFVPHRAAALYAAPSEEQPWWNRTRLARSDGAGGRSDESGSRAEGLRIGERSGRSVGAAAAAAATSSSSHAFYCVDDTNAAGGGDDWETEGNVEERCGSPSHSPPALQTTSVQPHQQHGGEDSEEASEGHRAELLRAMPQFLSVDLCLRLPDAEDSGHSSFSEAGAAGEEGVARGEGEGNHEHGSGGQPISIKLVHSFDFEDDAHDDEEEEENDSESRAVVQQTSRLNGDSDGEGSRLVNARAPTVMWRQGDPLSASNSQESRPATVAPHTSSLAAEACGDWDQRRRVREAAAAAAVGHASEHTPSRSTGSTANSADAAVFEVRRDTLIEAEAYTRACIAESADAVRATWAAVWAALQRAATAMTYEEEDKQAATPLATSPASSPDVLTRLTSAFGSPTSVAPPPLSVPVLLAGVEVSRNAKRKKAGDVVARTAAGEDRGPTATAVVLNVAETPPVVRVAGLGESMSSPHVSAVAPAAAHTPNALSVAEHATPSSFLIGPSSTSFRTPDNTPSVQTDGTETAEEAAGDSVGPSAVQGRSSGDTASGPILSTFNEGSATRQDTAVAAAAAARQRGTAPVGRVLSSPTPPPSPTRITVLAQAAAAGAANADVSTARGASPDPFPPPQPTAGDVNAPHVTIVAPLYTDLHVRRRASSSSATASSPSPHSPYQEHAAASSASLTSSQLNHLHHYHLSHTRSSTRRPSMGQVVCRWCGGAYSSAVTCTVAQRPHSVLRAERKREKAAKREAQALLCDGRVAEAVALLRQVGLYVP